MKKFFCAAAFFCIAPLLFAGKHFETEGDESCFFYYTGDIYSDTDSHLLDFESFYGSMDKRSKGKNYEFIFVKFAIDDARLVSVLRSNSSDDVFEYRDKSGSRAILSFVPPQDEGYKTFFATEKNAYALAKETFKVFVDYADYGKKRIVSPESFAAEMDSIAKNFNYRNIVVKTANSASFGQPGQYWILYESSVANNAIVFSISCADKDTKTVMMTFTDEKENVGEKGGDIVFGRNYGMNYNEAKRDFKTQTVF